MENTFLLSPSNDALPPSNSKVVLQYALLNTNRYAEVTENHILMSASFLKSAAEREISSQKHTWDHVADQKSHPLTIYIRQLIFCLLIDCQRTADCMNLFIIDFLLNKIILKSFRLNKNEKKH